MERSGYRSRHSNRFGKDFAGMDQHQSEVDGLLFEGDISSGQFQRIPIMSDKRMKTSLKELDALIAGSEDSHAVQEYFKIAEDMRKYTKVGRTPARDSLYLAFIRSKPCGDCGIEYQVQAHHVGTQGRGVKTDDYRAVPRCVNCHSTMHTSGEGLEYLESEIINLLIEYLRSLREV
jgi:hypothetical protein